MTTQVIFCRRKDFERMYQQPRGKITDQEMLDRAKQQTKKEAQNRQFRNEKDRADHIDRNGNILAVAGDPGIGKTTSAKNSVGQFLSGEFVTNVTFLFFIMIREIKFKEDVALLKLLSNNLPNWEHSEKSDKYWLQKIVTDRNVVIVLGGLDEADVDDFAIAVPSVKTHKPAQPFHIVLNLVSGKLLPYAKIIVTAQPVLPSASQP